MATIRRVESLQRISLGPVNLIRAVLPTLRAQRSGHHQPPAPQRRFPTIQTAHFMAARSGAGTITESLRLELAPLGIA